MNSLVSAFVSIFLLAAVVGGVYGLWLLTKFMLPVRVPPNQSRQTLTGDPQASRLPVDGDPVSINVVGDEPSKP